MSRPSNCGQRRAASWSPASRSRRRHALTVASGVFLLVCNVAPGRAQTAPAGYTVSNYASNLPLNSAGITGLAMDTSTRTLYYGQENTFGPLRKITPERTVSIVSSMMVASPNDGSLYPFVATDLEYYQGGVYFVSGAPGNVQRVDTTTGQATVVANFAGFNFESGMVIRDGVLYATSGDTTINSTTPGVLKTLNLSTLAQNTLATGLSPYASSLEYDPAKNLYYFVAKNINGFNFGLMKVAPGGVATQVSSGFLNPLSSSTPPNMALEPSGAAAYIPQGTNIVRVNTATGATSTFVSGLTGSNCPDLVFGPSSNARGWSLYVGDGTRIVEVAGFSSPNAPVASNQTISDVSEDTSKTIALGATDADVLDTLSYTMTSLPAHGQLFVGNSASVTEITTVPFALPNSGQTITFKPAANYNGSDSFRFQASDGLRTSNEATVSLTVNPVNDVPVVSGVTITPSAPLTNSNLTALVDASDVDNVDLTYKYVWKKNDVVIEGQTGATLPASATSKGDEITVTVTANDGDADSTEVSSPAVTIGNSVPVVNTVSLAPAAPLTNSILTATVDAADDDSTDSLSYTYVWEKNDVVIEDESGPTLDLSKDGNGDDGDKISVTVTANDGTSDSLSVESEPVTIQNLAPTVQSLSPEEGSNKVGDKRTFALTISDANGVKDIKEAWLLVNTRLNWAEGATLIYVADAETPTSGLLYLRRGDAFPAPIRIGAGAVPGAVLDNGAVRVVGSEVSVTLSEDGNGLTLSIPATIRDGLVGNNKLFTRVVDRSGALDSAALAGDNGYRRFGAYTVTPQFGGQENSAPTLSGLSPRVANTRIPATGVQLQTFVFYAKDDNGIGDIESLWFMVGKQANWTRSATFVYQPRTRRLFLRSDDGQSFLGGGQIGTAGTIENSKVKVDLSKVQVIIYPDGKNIGLRLPLQAKSGLVGQNTIWLRAQDLQGAAAVGSDAQGFVSSGS